MLIGLAVFTQHQTDGCVMGSSRHDVPSRRSPVACVSSDKWRHISRRFTTCFRRPSTTQSIYYIGQLSCQI